MDFIVTASFGGEKICNNSVSALGFIRRVLMNPENDELMEEFGTTINHFSFKTHGHMGPEVEYHFDIFIREEILPELREFHTESELWNARTILCHYN